LKKSKRGNGCRDYQGGKREKKGLLCQVSVLKKSAGEEEG